MEYSRSECESNGKRVVAETLSGFLESSTVAKCHVQLSDSRCGVYAVSALSYFLSNVGLPQTDFDFCPLVFFLSSLRYLLFFFFFFFFLTICFFNKEQVWMFVRLCFFFSLKKKSRSSEILKIIWNVVVSHFECKLINHLSVFVLYHL